MIRPEFLLHPSRDPAPLRPAATVLLLRDSEGGPEVLMTRRSLTASFAPGAYVFPGGTIDAADAQAHALCWSRGAQSAEVLTHALAALRECFEELGVLLARSDQGQPIAPSQVSALDRKADFYAQCDGQPWRLAADELFLLAHWITDRDLPRRFDVPFFVARMPDGQLPVADETEQFEPMWVRPFEALQAHKEGQFLIVYPTIKTLERLLPYRDVQALLDACSADEAPLWTSCPRAGLLRGEVERFMEHESPYGELALTCPEGQIAHALDWQSEAAVPLLRHVQRLTAPNPGTMTGPGTNSYIVGEAETGFIVIDPGPADAAHIERLHHACQGDVRAIVCTHSHPDHAPGAALLQALCAHRPPIWGLPSAPTARSGSHFVPDRVLADGDILPLQNRAGQTLHRLQALHTPGHAANHLCLMLLEDGLLFSGDHILNGSTTVIDPPDGHMGDYLASLDKLSLACQEAQAEYIFPAHGHVLGQARAAIAALKAHRHKREEKIARVIAAQPQGSLEDWLPQAYDDVPPALWPVARRSLLAHVQHLQEQGRAPKCPVS